MKAEPYELTFKVTTKEEFAQIVKDGGWVEYHMFCPLCDAHYPHRHYICSACGQIDFANKKTCFECWNASEIHRIRGDVMAYVRKHGWTMRKLGVLAVIILFTIANWRTG